MLCGWVCLYKSIFVFKWNAAYLQSKMCKNNIENGTIWDYCRISYLISRNNTNNWFDSQGTHEAIFFYFECKWLWIKPSAKFVNVTKMHKKVDYYNRYGMEQMRQVYYTKSTGQSLCPNLLHPLWKTEQTNNNNNIKRFWENQKFCPSEAYLGPCQSASLWRLDCLPAFVHKHFLRAWVYSGPAVKTRMATAIENMIHAMHYPCQDTAALSNLCGGPEPLFPKPLKWILNAREKCAEVKIKQHIIFPQWGQQ